MIRKPHQYPRTCPICNSSFVAKHHLILCCSKECYIAKKTRPAFVDCILWEGTDGIKHHYGMYSYDGLVGPTGRIFYSMTHGPIPKGMVVRHKCDHPGCVNVDHLEIGTQADNNRDQSKRLRNRRGTSHFSAKLTDDDVRNIRKSTKNNCELAKDYGVHNTTIRNIKLGLSWSHVV